MYAKFFALAALATVVVAAPGGTPSGGITNSCNVGTQQCCNQVQEAHHQTVQDIAAGDAFIAAALALAPITIPVGVDCSPITAIGVAGNNCNAQPVCCENNNFNGLVAIGCSPINVNL